MGIRKFCAAFLLLLPATLGAQFSDGFGDGNHTAAPAWSGDVSSFSVVADSDAGPGAPGAQVLRLSAPTGSGLKYLSVAVPGSWGSAQVWGFFLGRRAQAATASNVAYVWLWAGEATVAGAAASGYRVRFGDDNGGDEVVLECVQSGVARAIISSSGSVPNGLADYGFHVRITRSASGAWQLYTSPLPAAAGGGTPAAAEGTVATELQGSGTDATFSHLDDGFLAIAASHTSGAAARAGLEVDGVYLQTAGGTALPVRFRSFRADRTKEGVQVSAVVEEAESPTHFYLQRGGDGRQFSDWQSPAPRAVEGGLLLEATDRDRHSGAVYYRLRAVEDSISTYSPVIMVAEGPVPGVLYIWPNPVRPGRPVLVSGTGGTGYLILYNSIGFPVATKYCPNAAASLNWDLPPLVPGLYHLRWTGPSPATARLLIF